MLKQYSTKILWVCLVVAMAYIYHQDKRYEELVTENAQSSEQLVLAETLLRDVEEKLALLEKTNVEKTNVVKNSIESVLVDTSEVVVSGWKILLDRVNEALTDAKNRFNEEASQILKDNAAPPTQPALPNSEDSPIIEGERT
jgi:CMP-N-acetylneuraminic acid synthetase